MKTLIFTSLVFLLSVQLSNAQWMLDSTGMGSKIVYSLANSGSNIFAGTNLDGVFKSTNNGDNWTQTALNNRHVAAFGINGSNIFAGGYSYGVYRSLDYGTTWTYLTPLNNQQVNALLAIGTNIIAGVWGNGIFLSTNNGDNWTQTSVNSGTLALTISGSNIFAGTRENGVLLSTNNGNNWTQTALNTGYVNEIGIYGNDIFAASTGGLYLSTNDGASWTLISNMGSIIGLAKYSSYLFAASGGFGVYVSSDNGANWIQRNEGLGNWNVRAILILNDYIFAGTAASIYRRPIAEVIGIHSISTEIPNQFSLSQNYPNPFNPVTNIKFQIVNNSFVILKIYDITGREIQTLVNEKQVPGTYEVNWDASGYSSGLYFYRISADNFTDVKKMILVK